ncbi:Transposase [Bacteroidales bacterium Barb4]|nr:Transposase [Bacteroidales bacterium Barb4]
MKQVAGIDISNSNDYEGFKGFLEWSVKGVSLKYVMEAAGCYHEDLAWFLHDNGQEVCVVLANKIKHYAKSLNVKTKTDKADAAPIADFGLERNVSGANSMPWNTRITGMPV